MADEWGLERGEEHVQWTPELRARVAKAGLSLVSFPGSSIIGDWLVDRLQGRRQENFELLLEELSARVGELEERHYERLETPRVVDILEDAAVSAGRALTRERIGYIAQVVANGIKGIDPKVEKEKLTLRMLERLSDEQIVMLYDLTYLSRDIHRRRAYHEIHANVPMGNMGTFTEETREAIIVQSDRVRGLIDLGLVRGGESWSEASGRSLMNIMQPHDAAPLSYWFLKQIGLEENSAPHVETPLG